MTDGMLLAAARALAGAAPAGSLLPPLAQIREVSRAVALAVGAAAADAGVAPPAGEAELTGAVDALVWEPRYRRIVPARVEPAPG